MDGAVPAGAAGPTCVLGLDVGTASVRGALHDEGSGVLVADVVEPLAVHERGGTRELDFEDAWQRIGGVLDRLAQAVGDDRPVGEDPSVVEDPAVGRRPPLVRHVAIATTASTIAAFDADLRPIGRGITWADHRATREAEEIRVTRHPVLARTLGHVSPEWGLPKLLHLWRARQGDGMADRGAPGEDGRGAARRPIRFVLELLDWLDWKLTGRLVANAGIREWGWCVDDHGRWPADLVARVGLAEALRLVPDETAQSGTSLGPVRPELARRHPLLGAATATMGGMDSYLAALGMGVVRDGRLTASFGSSSSLLARADVGDAAGHLYGPFRRILPGPAGGYWHGGQSTAGLAVEWAIRLLGRPRTELEALASEVPPGSEGVVFRETFLDRRTPDPEAGLRAVWDGLALAHGPGHLYRSVLEGVAFGARWAALPLRPGEIVITGGLARSPLFRTILAGVLGRGVGMMRHELAAGIGAAFAHDPERLIGLNPVVETTFPSPGGANLALEQAFRRYRALHRLPRSLGGAPAPAAPSAA